MISVIPRKVGVPVAVVSRFFDLNRLLRIKSRDCLCFRSELYYVKLSGERLRSYSSKFPLHNVIIRFIGE